jgi:hypothetical protein
MNGNALDEHFAFTSKEDRLRTSRLASRSGRTSPSHSAHCSLIRHSILKVSDGKKAKKVRFYRNGDRFFKGMIYAVSAERFRTFEALLAELTVSPLCDKVVLPNGVRHIFSADDGRKVQNLEELEEGESYVCATTDVFKRMEYSDKVPTPHWNPTIRGQGSSGDSAIMSPVARDNGIDADFFNKEFIRPKLVTVIRNGSKPRKAVRILLNRKTAHSFSQVLDDITDAIKLDSGAVKKIFTLDGRPVSSLF